MADDDKDMLVFLADEPDPAAEQEETAAAVWRVLLVDDVYTTGSTMDELARILKKAGVKEVFFLVLCIGKGKKDGMHGEKSVLY